MANPNHRFLDFLIAIPVIRMTSVRGSICSSRCLGADHASVRSPAQCGRPLRATGRHLGTWFVRLLVGACGFKACSEAAASVSSGLRYWTEQMGQRAAFAFHRDLSRSSIFLSADSTRSFSLPSSPSPCR